MKNFRFIFLRLSLYLIASILSAFYLSVENWLVLTTVSLSLVFFVLIFLRSKKQLFPDSWPGIATFVLVFSLGLLSTYYSIPGNQSDHYLQKDLKSDKILFARVRLTEELKPTAFSFRYLGMVEELISGNKTEAASGKLLINVKDDSLKLQPGNEILVPWRPEEINIALNPFQFDYRNYMQKLGVERQINFDSHHIRLLSEQNKNIQEYAWDLREELISKLKNYSFGRDELAIFQALILGQRREINDQLYENYAAAGAIHILAISGLHIGILLLLLNFLLKPLERAKYGRLLKPVLIIILLWAFTILTGLSPSVVRAVFMFSFIAIGLQLKRKTSTLNSLFVSLFFLLLINPGYLFQVGFQLSYLAVFSIVVLQPHIYGILRPRFKLIEYFWKIVSVSLAAQIGVLPLSLFYFHQFPGLFLISNMVVLPFLGLILGVGILVILMAFLGILPNLLAEIFGSILNLLNAFIQGIANIDSLVFTDIDFSLLQSIILYLIIFGMLLILRRPNFLRLRFFLISIILFQLATFYNKMSIPENELVVFHKSRATVIGKKQHQDLYLFTKMDTSPKVIQDYKRERKIENTELKNIPRLLSVKKDLILLIDTAAYYNLPSLKPDIIILRNSPKLNMDRLVEQQPRQVIADGSNYPSFIKRWKRTFETKKIPFHYTGEKGAYILKY